MPDGKDDKVEHVKLQDHAVVHKFEGDVVFDAGGKPDKEPTEITHTEGHPDAAVMPTGVDSERRGAPND